LGGKTTKTLAPTLFHTLSHSRPKRKITSPWSEKEIVRYWWKLVLRFHGGCTWGFRRKIGKSTQKTGKRGTCVLSKTNLCKGGVLKNRKPVPRKRNRKINKSKKSKIPLGEVKNRRGSGLLKREKRYIIQDATTQRGTWDNRKTKKEGSPKNYLGVYEWATVFEEVGRLNKACNATKKKTADNNSSGHAARQKPHSCSLKGVKLGTHRIIKNKRKKTQKHKHQSGTVNKKSKNSKKRGKGKACVN